MTTYHTNGTHEMPADETPTPTRGEKLRQNAETAAQGVRDGAAAARDRAGETVTRSMDEGARFVRENPGAALAGALGVGVLIGLALRGRD
ncbi:MAG: hypothetical protein AAFV31_14290 [Pseudomonadota bacterium]